MWKNVRRGFQWWPLGEKKRTRGTWSTCVHNRGKKALAFFLLKKILREKDRTGIEEYHFQKKRKLKSYSWFRSGWHLW